MTLKPILAVSVFLFLSVSGPLSAQDSFIDRYLTDPTDGAFDASNYLQEVPMGFLPVPVVITDPATGNGLGLGAIFFHESEEQKEQRIEAGALLPENISIAGAGATENGTWAAGFGHLGFWKQDTLRYRGFAGYPSLNLDFYSLPGIDLPRPVELNIEGLFGTQTLSWRVPESNWFIGGTQLYREVETTFAGDLPAILPPGFSDFVNDHIHQDITTSGLGTVLEYDSRDNPMNPAKGHDLSLSYLWFRDGIGSDVDYDSYTITSLNYWQFRGKVNLGIRLDYQAVETDNVRDLPTYVPPAVNMRGLASAQYQGLRVATTEIQVDYLINTRWKVGIFSGLARTADSVSDLGSADNIDTIGTGFRYLVARRYGFAMGIDIAKGPDDTAWYIQAGSAW